jgi:hypothetical protein
MTSRQPDAMGVQASTPSLIATLSQARFSRASAKEYCFEDGPTLMLQMPRVQKINKRDGVDAQPRQANV